MPKHQIIRDAGQTLLGVLRAELSAQKSKAKAYLALPNPEFLRKSSPCLALYLYDLRPFVDVRIDEKWQLEEEIVDEKGESVVVRYGRPLELELRYLLTASADDLADEHEILALGMKAFLDHPKVSGELLVGDGFFKHDALAVAPDPEFGLDVSAKVFAGFGVGPRLAIGYRTQVRLASGKELGRTKRVRERHIDVFDPLRPPQGSVSAKELGVEAKSPKIVAAPAKK